MVSTERPKNFKPKFEVVSCILESEGKLLCLLRQDYKPQGNKWGLPAGKVDTGETPIKAITREVKEEIGHDLVQSSLKYFKSFYVVYYDYSFIYHVHHYPINSKPKIIINKVEHKEYKWVTPQEFLNLDLVQDEAPCIMDFYKIKS